MHHERRSSFVTDLKFPLAIFFVFAVSSLAVLLLAANIYETNNRISGEDYVSRVGFAYLAEQIRQHDGASRIAVEEHEGIDCLVIRDEEQDIATYFYAFNGKLMGLRTRSDIDFVPEGGTELVEAKAFSAEELGGGLYRLSFTNPSGEVVTTYVAKKSSDASTFTEEESARATAPADDRRDTDMTVLSEDTEDTSAKAPAEKIEGKSAPVKKEQSDDFGKGNDE